MGTLHANTPRECLSRIESMITMGGFSLPSKTLREMICSSIDVIIQAQRMRDGSRRITHITEVMGMEGDVIITQDLMLYDVLGEDPNGRLIGRHRSTGIGRPRLWERARYFGDEQRLATALDQLEAEGRIAAAILAAVSAGGIAYALFYPWLSGQVRTEQRRREFAAPAAIRAAADREAQGQLRRGQVAQSLKDIENREKARHKVTIERRIEQAGLSWSRKQYWLLGGAMGVALALVLFIASGNWVVVLVGFLVGLFGVPRWYLGYLGKRRMQRFINEFPNAIDVIVRGIKSGLPLNDCL
eukprot:gene33582-43116_t